MAGPIAVYFLCHLSLLKLLPPTLSSWSPMRVLLPGAVQAKRSNLVQKQRKALFFDQRADRCEIWL